MTAVRSVTAEVAEFGNNFRGSLMRAGDEGYDEARRVHNGLINKKPALIAWSSARSPLRLRWSKLSRHCVRSTPRKQTSDACTGMSAGGPGTDSCPATNSEQKLVVSRTARRATPWPPSDRACQSPR